MYAGGGDTVSQMRKLNMYVRQSRAEREKSILAVRIKAIKLKYIWVSIFHYAAGILRHRCAVKEGYSNSCVTSLALNEEP